MHPRGRQLYAEASQGVGRSSHRPDHRPVLRLDHNDVHMGSMLSLGFHWPDLRRYHGGGPELASAKYLQEGDEG